MSGDPRYTHTAHQLPPSAHRVCGLWLSPRLGRTRGRQCTSRLSSATLLVLSRSSRRGPTPASRTWCATRGEYVTHEGVHDTRVGARGAAYSPPPSLPRGGRLLHTDCHVFVPSVPGLPSPAAWRHSVGFCEAKQPRGGRSAPGECPRQRRAGEPCRTAARGPGPSPSPSPSTCQHFGV